MNVRVRRIGLASAAKFGFVSGVIGAAPIGLIVAVIARFAVGWLHRLLESWQGASIDVGIVGKIPIDLVRLMNLGSTLAAVKRWDEMPALLIAFVFLTVVLFAGLLTSISDAGQAAAYNNIAAISSGLEVELEPGDGGKIMVMRGK